MNESAADAVLRQVLMPTVGVAHEAMRGHLPKGDQTLAGERLLQL
jgi:hypothetical protein